MNTSHKKNKKKKVHHLHEGTLRTTARGIGFVSIPNYDDDIRIQNSDLNTGLDGDTVEIIIHPTIVHKPVTGEITRVISRGTKTFVGTIEHEDGIFYIKPQNRKSYTNFLLISSDDIQAKNGYKAHVAFEKWDNPKKLPECTLVRLIGPAGEHETEIAAILQEQNIDSSFPDDVERESQQLKEKSAAMLTEAISKRRDMRNILTFTVDPDDAKDFDDALSFEKLPDGDIQIGVHIADVSHYVQLGTALDTEAQRRGTSVYLVDRTIPMLPEVLSNDLCSLNPEEDKLAFSALFTFSADSFKSDGSFAIRDVSIEPTIIHSDRRFTYAEVEEIIEGGPGDFTSEILLMQQLAEKLEQKNRKSGALSFHSEEVKFNLDEDGKPNSVELKKSGKANKMIEHYMLLANKTITEYVDAAVPKKDRVFLYRIHDKPSIEALEELALLFREFGHTLPVEKGTVSRQELNELLDSIQDRPEAHLLNISTIRSMEKAVYSTQNIGHFGLAFRQYTHFTSPIRRYPDVIVHRLVKSYLENHHIPHKEWKLYKEWSNTLSNMERKAMEAERASIKYKQAEYMERFIGKEIDGTISGVAEWGIFIEHKDSLSEGLIPLRNLSDDYYVFDEKKKRIVGKKTKRVFQLGDSLRVVVDAVDVENRRIDFSLPQ